LRDIRIAVGGVAYKPWRLESVERRLAGHVIDRAMVAQALADFDAAAEPLSENAYKIDLARALIMRAVCSVMGSQ
jgi:xanthine dehydrogenase YagS FAD-binding subunit